MVSSGERAVFVDVRRVVEVNDCTLHISTKLSDIVDPSTVPQDLRDWSTRAHVDLLVRSEERAMTPLFAIEVDGSQHLLDPEQARRDRAKDRALEAAGIDVIRIAGDTVERTNGRERLSAYLAELWFSARAFHQAQADGLVGPFEVFMPSFTFQLNQDSQRMECLDPTMAVRARFFEASERTGVPKIPIPQTWQRYDDRVARVRVKTLLALNADQYLGCDLEIGGFCGVGVPPAEIAEELALAELGRLFDQWTAGAAVAMHVRQLDRWLPPETSPLGQEGGWRPACWGGEIPGWLASALPADRVRLLGYRTQEL